MSDIKRVYSQPNASSLKEGEEVVYLGRSKPLARYRKEGGQVWVSYMTTNGDLFVEKDFNVQGTISQGGTGGGSGPPIVKGGLIEQTAGGLGVSTAGTTGAVSFASGTPAVGTLPPVVGGTGQDLSGSTGAISVSSGTVAAGTLPVAVGGTNATDSDTWLNTRVKIQSDGTLEYDNTSDAAMTMNTLADANNIRARVTGSLASGNGLNTGIAIGDAVQTAVIFSGQETMARSADNDTITNSVVWSQTDDTSVIKVAINYLHNSNNRGLKLSCLLRSSSACLLYTSPSPRDS